MKYVLTNRTERIVWGGEWITLYAIKAARDIHRFHVEAGDIGGFVQSEANLSQDGDAWIEYGAKVYENALVSENALVGGYSKVAGNAKIFGNAKLRDHAEICDNAKIFGTAIVEAATIRSDAQVYEDARVCGNVDVCYNAKVHGRAKVESSVWIGFGSTQIGKDRDLTESFYDHS